MTRNAFPKAFARHPISVGSTISNVSLASNLTIAKVATLQSTLSVAKAATLASTLSVASAVTLASTLSAAAAATMASTLSVGGTATLGAAAVLGGATSNSVGFYGSAGATQRAGSTQATTNVAVSASFGATQLAALQEVMNVLIAAGLMKGSA